MCAETTDARPSSNVRIARADLQRAAKQAARAAIAGVLQTTDARTLGTAKLSRAESTWVAEKAARAARVCAAGCEAAALERGAEKAAREAIAALVAWVEDKALAKARRAVLTAQHSRDRRTLVKGAYAQLFLAEHKARAEEARKRAARGECV